MALMRFDVLTLFPAMFESFCATSIIGKAIEAEKIEVVIHDIRDYTLDKHRKVDDVPYGGGAGMVMTPDPLFRCIEHVQGLSDDTAPVVFLTPHGERMTQPLVEDIAAKAKDVPRMILLCGHYEGIDQRVRDSLVDREISLGDFVLTGGELPAQVLIDAVVRLLPGVLGNEASHEEESFSEVLERGIEYPHYTRPAVYRGMEIPDVLQSGHHAKIEEWRKENTRKPQ